MKRIFSGAFLAFLLALMLGAVCSSAARAADPLSDPSRNDTPYIQSLIDHAAANAQPSVTIPSINPADGSNLYQIGAAIVLPSNITVILDNCTLRLNDGTLCNIFMSKGCYNASMSADEELENIKIIGIGDATLDGGVHNGVTEKTATRPNGYYTVRHNTTIHFRNVNGFEIKNLTIKEPRYWGMTFLFSRNGTISNITFDCSNKAPNQDGIDLRIGCNNITIEDISGITGDDTVALTALNGTSDVWFDVDSKSHNIHDVTIRNVKSFCKGGHAIVRLLTHHGNQVYNVDIQNIEDCSTTTHPNVVLRLGDTNYAGGGTPMSYGDIHHITVDGVISNAKYALYAGNHNVSLEHVTYSNVTIKYKNGLVTNLTPNGKTFVPLTYIEGSPIFLFDGSDPTDWLDNTTQSVAFNYGSLEGSTSTASVWPFNGDTLPEEEFPQIITPVFQVNTNGFDCFRVSLIALNNGYDTPVDDLILYYSTDNGTSWTPISVTMAEHGKLWTTSTGSGTFYVSSFVSEELCPGVNLFAPITHMMIRPYGNSRISGAFRLLSMDVRGTERELTKFHATNVDLGSTLDVNFYYPKDGTTVSGYYAKLVRSYADGSPDEVSVIPSDRWAVNGAFYQITYDGLAAKQMCDEIRITIFDSTDLAISQTVTESVRSYAMRALETLDSSDAISRTALVDMLNYGAAAQAHFSYGADDPANRLLSKEQQAEATQSVTCQNISQSSEHVYASNLDLENRIQLNFFFTNVTSSMSAKISYTDHSGKSRSYTVSKDDFFKNGKYYQVCVKDLAVADGNTAVTCIVYDETGSVHASATESMNSYVARALGAYPWMETIAKFSASAARYLHSK